jgi:hypothetical protein
MGQQPKNAEFEFSSPDEAREKVADAARKLDESRMSNVQKRKRIMRDAGRQERQAKEAYGDKRPYWNND